MATAYSAAKAGLNALTRAAALEYAAAAIRVNGIICGTFDTDAAAGFVRNLEMLPEVVRLIALGRVGRPEEIVGAAVLPAVGCLQLHHRITDHHRWGRNRMSGMR